MAWHRTKADTTSCAGGTAHWAAYLTLQAPSRGGTERRPTPHAITGRAGGTAHWAAYLTLQAP
ncbi:hypothetical protein GCM10017774_63070 [Lentzea cavernae]|uniref:Uncharacterized protein n=1 Tax=Lentzea cavernae TaxID=2020703 RepID=A0ABQ3MNA7_9PSEU|nr:hypothetical protein GCM10017774_63070 [Lentzea cavernae]